MDRLRGFFVIPSLSRIGTAHLTSAILMMLIVIAMEAAIAGVFVSQVDLTVSVASRPDPLNQTSSGQEYHFAASCSATNQTGVITNNNARSIVTYLVIFILALAFQMIIVVDALQQQNTIQVFMHCLFVVAMLAYSVFQYFQLRDLLNACTLNVQYQPNSSLDFSATAALTCNPGCQLFNLIKPFIATAIAVLALFVLVYFYLAFKLYLEFGWKIYKKIGADPNMRNMYRSVQIFLMLLKLDFFFFEAFSIQFLYLVLQPTDPEYILTIIAICLAFFIVYGAYQAIAYEKYWAVSLWMVVLLGLMAYYSFKIARIYDPTQSQKYNGSGKFLTLFAALGLGVTTLSLVFTIICIKNFGKELKTHLTADGFWGACCGSSGRGKEAEAEGGEDSRRRMEIE